MPVPGGPAVTGKPRRPTAPDADPLAARIADEVLAEPVELDPLAALTVEVADAAADWEAVRRHPTRVRPERILQAERRLVDLAVRYRALRDG